MNIRIIDKANWLLENIDLSIEDIAFKRKKNRFKSSILKVSILVLSASTTVLLGLNIANLDGGLRNIAFVASAIVSLITSLEPFFNFRTLWVSHEKAKGQFHRLKDELCYYLEGIDDSMVLEKDINEFKKVYQSIWIELSKSYINQRNVSLGVNMNTKSYTEGVNMNLYTSDTPSQTKSE